MNTCPITRYRIKEEEIIPTADPCLFYENEYVGKVKVAISSVNELSVSNDRFLIGGICKHRTMNGEAPILINGDFIRSGFNKYSPPIHFEEKCYTLLKTLYMLGGRENNEFELNPTKDFALAYASFEEFERIIDKLHTDYLISIKRTLNMSANRKLFMGVKLTSSGISEAEKALPKMPMFNLVSQEISTGDAETDVKINHARELFFSEPSSMDKKRSACETLSYVLEPLRENLKGFFGQKEVSDFFQIVNSFDIRHNKDSTKNLQHEEQLEWVFYTLLNTINTYTKLKAKGL